MDNVNKILKVEKSLLDLNNEIMAALKFLNNVKDQANKLVKNLNKLSSPTIFLKEFVQVNSFLLKHLNFLNEINCRFEMFQIQNGESFQETSVQCTEKSNSADKNWICMNFSSSKLIEGEERSPNKARNIPEDEVVEAKTKITNGSVDLEISIKKREKGRKNRKNSNSDIENSSRLTNVTAERVNNESSSDSTVGFNFDEISDTSDFSPTKQSTPSKQSCVPVANSQKEEDVEEESLLPIDRGLFGVNSVYGFPKVGDEFEVTVEHIKSPSEFYVQIISRNANPLAELEKRLKLVPVNKKILNTEQGYSKCLLKKSIGDYALYFSKCEEIWCRAKILDWCLNDENPFVCIFLLDYGESKRVTVDSLQPIPEFLKKIPACVHRCHLYGIHPVGVNEDGKMWVWDRESSESMKYLLENSKKQRIKIATGDGYHPSNSLPVVLQLVDRGYVCVNELLVKRNHAVEACSENLDDWNPMKEDYESYQNNYDLSINDPAAVIYGYVGKDYERVCWHFAEKGRCYKGEACKKEHTNLDPLGFTTDTEEVFRSSFNTLPCPFVDEVINVQVTCLQDVNKFCCIRANATCGEDEECLSTLLKFMNRLDNVQSMRKLLIPPSTGQIVIAQYSEDSSWYRAKVLESDPENDLYTVFFVDYGNKEELSLRRIRAIEARYLHLPFQAMQCHVFGVEKNPKVPLSEAISYFENKLGDGDVTIKVVSKLPGSSITLQVHVFNKNKVNVGQDLVAKGYALNKEEIVVSDHCDTLPG